LLRRRTSIALEYSPLADIAAVVDSDFVKLLDELRLASVPQTPDNALAIGVAEAVAGGAGGLVSRGVAGILGDKKVDNLQTKVSSTSAFFGVRGLVRGLGRVVGLPRPLSLVLSSLLASAFSEFTKNELRKLRINEMAAAGAPPGKLGNESVHKTEEKEEVISFSEVAGDISKWLVFDLSVEYLPPQLAIAQGIQKNAIYFSVGAVSGISGLSVRDFFQHAKSKFGRENNKAANSSDDDKKKTAIVKYATAAIEGGVLFGMYACFFWIVSKTIPEQFGRQQFFFNQLVEKVEAAIAIAESDI